MATAAVATVGHNNPPSLREVLAENYSGLTGDVEAIASKADGAPKNVTSEADLTTVGDIVKDVRQLTKRVDLARVSEKEPYLQGGRDVDAFFKVLTERLDRITKTLEGRATEYQREKATEERRRREEEARRLREQEERQREIARKAEEANRSKTAAKHEDKAEELATKAAEAEAATQVSAAELTRVRSMSGTVATARTEWAFEITDYNEIPLEVLRPYLARADVEKAIRTFVRVNKNSVALTGVRIFEDVKASFR